MRRSRPPGSPGRRRRSTGVLLAGALASSVVASVAASAPIASATVIDWNTCLANSGAAVTFASPSVNWLDTDQVSWTANLSPACPTDTVVDLIEDTDQINQNAQSFVVGQPSGSTIVPTLLSGSMNVTPLRSLPWSISLFSPENPDISSPNQLTPLGSGNVTVVQPTGPLPGGQTALTVTANTTDQRRAFAEAVQTPGAVVNVAAGVNLDLSGLVNLFVAPNVQIIGDRSINDLAGPRLFTTTYPHDLFVVPSAAYGVSHERITGLELDGGAPDDPFANLGDDDANGITIEKPNVEVDHDDLHSWRGAAVSVSDNGNVIDQTDATSVYIHDNFIHLNQHPTSDLPLGGHGEGYGVETDNGGTALVIRNVFDDNRHAIAGDGRPGTGYYFYSNLILPGGGVNNDVSHTHAIDMHGLNTCSPIPVIDVEGDHNCGPAGEYMDIQDNTVEYDSGADVHLRGTPSQSMDIDNNVFAQDDQGDAINYNEVSPIIGPHNTYGFDAAAHTMINTTCDFDGDGTADPVLASGQTIWYQSSRLDGRWIFLDQSTATGSAVQLGDVNGDGLCDLTIGGQVIPNPDPAIPRIPPTTVPSLGLLQQSAAQAALQAANLTVGKITTVVDTHLQGTVIGQSLASGLVVPQGTAVALTVSAGQLSMPNVVGDTISRAESLLNGTSLDVTESVDSNCVNPGEVTGESPAAGTDVAQGANVTIDVCPAPPPGSGSGGGGGTGTGGGGGGHRPPFTP